MFQPFQKWFEFRTALNQIQNSQLRVQIGIFTDQNNCRIAQATHFKFKVTISKCSSSIYFEYPWSRGLKLINNVLEFPIYFLFFIYLNEAINSLLDKLDSWWLQRHNDYLSQQWGGCDLILTIFSDVLWTSQFSQSVSWPWPLEVVWSSTPRILQPPMQVGEFWILKSTHLEVEVEKHRSDNNSPEAALLQLIISVRPAEEALCEVFPTPHPSPNFSK